MNPNPDLAIILPLYNPHPGWDTEIVSSLDNLKKEFSGVDYCVTIVNDGSAVEVESIIKSKILPAYNNLNYLGYSENQGKGFAIRHGLKFTYSGYYIYSDFDFPFGIIPLKKMYEKLSAGNYNLVIATRDFSSVYKNSPVRRKILSLGLMTINFIITGSRIRDTQAGLKGLDNKAKNIFLTTKTNSYIFDLEFILKCLKEDLKFNLLQVMVNRNIKFTNFNSGIIKREIKNYIKIILGRI